MFCIKVNSVHEPLVGHQASIHSTLVSIAFFHLFLFFHFFIIKLSVEKLPTAHAGMAHLRGLPILLHVTENIHSMLYMYLFFTELKQKLAAARRDEKKKLRSTG